MKKYTNIAAVWLKKDKNDKTFLSFKAEKDIKAGDSIALFKNDKGDNQARPDFRAYTVEEENEDVAQDAMEALAEEKTNGQEPTPF